MMNATILEIIKNELISIYKNMRLEDEHINSAIITKIFINTDTTDIWVNTIDMSFNDFIITLMPKVSKRFIDRLEFDREHAPLLNLSTLLTFDIRDPNSIEALCRTFDAYGFNKKPDAIVRIITSPDWIFNCRHYIQTKR